jgi:hypothetical protein
LGDGCYPTCRQLAGIYLDVSNLAVTNLAATNLAVINLAVINLAVINLAAINLAAINLAAINLVALNRAAINVAAINLAAIRPCHQGLQNNSALSSIKVLHWTRHQFSICSATTGQMQNSAFALRPPGKCIIQHSFCTESLLPRPPRLNANSAL